MRRLRPFDHPIPHPRFLASFHLLYFPTHFCLGHMVSWLASVSTQFRVYEAPVHGLPCMEYTVGVSYITLSLHLFGLGDICGYPMETNKEGAMGPPRLEARRDGIEKVFYSRMEWPSLVERESTIYPAFHGRGTLSK